MQRFLRQTYRFRLVNLLLIKGRFFYAMLLALLVAALTPIIVTAGDESPAVIQARADLVTANNQLSDANTKFNALNQILTNSNAQLDKAQTNLTNKQSALTTEIGRAHV